MPADIPDDIEKVLDDHPDDVSPSRELKDITLLSAGAAAKAQREVEDLTGTVGALSESVSGLRNEVSSAVKIDEYRRGQRHMLRTLMIPVLIGAVSMLVLAGTVINTRNLNASNNKVLTKQIPAYEARIAQLEQENADLKDIQQQLTDAFLTEAHKLQDHGIDPGTFEIKPRRGTPPTTTPETPPTTSAPP